jgi:hypothetical protein
MWLASQTDRRCPNPSKPRRRWFQFSLRTLLVTVTVLCVFCAWMKVTVERAYSFSYHIAK